MRHSEFSYENLQTQSLRQMGQFESIPVNNSFFAVCNKQAAGSGTGWKMHISVAAADVGRAWNLLADYLIDQKIGQMKVATPGCAERFDDPTYRQAGKMITVYDFDMGHDWQRMAQDVESILERNGVRPGNPVKGDRALPGSSYISYRNDRGLNGYYVDSKEIAQYPAHQQYNISGLPDPFAHVRVSSATQGRWVNAVMDTGAQRTVPRPRAVPPLPQGVPEAQYWKPQRDQHDNPLMSLPIEGAPGHEVDRVKALLRQHGFTPEERQSKSMGGQVLYVTGEDASRLKQQLVQRAAGQPPSTASTPPRHIPPSMPQPSGQPYRGR